jgi:hypothetical protein
MDYRNIIIEEILLKFKPVTGKDHERYGNHVYRVFLNCLLIDAEKNNEEKYAIAAVFHDIGIWTNHTFDYLAPSIEQLSIYLEEKGKQHWTAEISQMIYWHHKISSYSGDFEMTVQTFRKADWIDVSRGLLRFGADKKKIKEITNKLPNRGFHLFLLKQTVKNFRKHPLNPIPVFKQ